jgi:protoporphyrinogen oxidase
VRIGVLGGGPLGLTAALRLAQAGHRVEVIERESVAGGLAAGFPVGGAYLEKFYHHLFRTDRAIVDLIREVGLAERLIWRRPDTSVLRGGRIWGLDSVGDVLRFGPLKPAERLRLGVGLAFLKALPDPTPLERTTATAWLRRWMGPRVYGTVWEPLLRGKFQAHAESVSMPWFWARVHCRTAELGYPRGGFQQVYDRLVEVIRRAGGQVSLSCAARAIEVQSDGGVQVSTDSDTRQYDRLVVTLPTRLFLRLAKGLPPDYVERYRVGSDHLSAHCLVLSLRRQLTHQTYWLNVNDPGFPFLSLVEHTNYLPPADYGGRRLVYLGNYLAPDHPTFGKSATMLLEEYSPHLRRINPAFSADWVEDVWSFSAPFAQPIVRVGYQASLPAHQTPLRGVFLANMGHVYPQDRGQNYSVLLGEKIAGLVQSGGRTTDRSLP